MKWTKVVIALGMVGIVLLAYQYKTNNLAHNKPTITMAVSKTPLSAPIYIAESLGFFKQSCVNVVIDDVIGGKNSFDQVMLGNADFGTSSNSVIVFQSMYHSDFVTLANFAQSDNDVKLITHLNMQANQNINADIKTNTDAISMLGKRIGVTSGSAGEYLLSTYLALIGLTIHDVEVLSYSPEKLPQALLNKDVDMIVAWEPYAYDTLQMLKNDVKVINTKNLNTLMFNLISHPIDSDAKLEQATCVLDALNNAINYIATNPESSRQIIATRLKEDPQFIDWVWTDYIFKLSLNRSLLMNLKSQGIWMIDSELVEVNNLPDYKMLLDERALKTVNPMAVRL
ncbi:ABC transporter substrate-binding protein [Psychromonas sp. KJ10-10]|uniref:ABC transporter substrate-binding protein n=1 Tax=Psychromonas sp. KJ10-10 TaxID=3391823 RepID=UPI0039B56DF7